MARASNVEDIYPLSPLQQGLLFHHLYAPASRAYLEQLDLRLAGELAVDPAVLGRALRLVVATHPALRTVFAWKRRERPLQLVLRRIEVPVRVVDALDLGHALAAERERAFDLTRPPLLRATLVRLPRPAGAQDTHLVLTYHHMLLDGWSLRRVFADLFAAYAALAAGRQPRLTRPRPFRDYVDWLQRQDLAAAEAFWRRELAGLRAPTALLVDRAPDADSGATERIAERRIAVPPAAALAVRAFARRQHLTFNSVAIAAWALLLGRYSGEREVLFGCVVSGRPDALAGVEEMVGLFINSLPVRVPLAAGAMLGRWLAELQARLFESRRHEHAPLAQIQRWSELPPGRPMFDSLLDVESYGGQAGAGEEGQGIAHIDSFERTHHALTLDVQVEPALSLRILYDQRRFDAVTVERTLQRFAVLLAEMARGGERPLDSLQPATAAEIQMLLVEPAAAIAAAAAPPRCLHGWFEQRAARTPAAVAVVFDGVELTYGDLNRQANQLAHHLVEQGVGPEVLVGVCLEREWRLPIALLAVLKAGGAYVPLDPAYPDERIAFILGDAGAPLLLTWSGAAGRWPGLATRRLVLEELQPALAGQPAGDPHCPVTPQNLAYVIYTSGTTGRPKGVMVSHGNVARLFTATEPWFGFGADGVVTWFHSFSFDFSVWEMWAALLYGGRLVGVPLWASRSPEALYRLLAEQGVTLLSQTPSAFRQLLRYEETAGTDARLRLRHVVFGGEALEPRSLAPWFRHHPAAAPSLVNMYGITETTVHVTYRPLTPDDLAGAASPLGVPIPDLRLVLLDGEGRLAPLGVPGEIAVSGPGLARGYLGQPALTAERFTPDAFSGEPGSRLYRSGDLARHRDGGDLDYLGRQDHQVKVRGFRIEPGEVEAALARHPGIGESVVVARESAALAGEKRLVAYCVPRPGAALALAEVQAFLATSLPDHMIPGAMVVLDALPLTASGKLDRAALPLPEAARPAAAPGHVPPATAAEAELAAIWGRVLAVARVGIDDDFFALGGDSILSIQVLMQARERGLELSLQQLFRHPTVRALARQLTAAGDAAPGAEGAAAGAWGPFALVAPGDRELMPEGVEDAYPLARLQAGMLFHGRLDPASAVYHNVSTLRLRAPCDVALLRAAVAALVARHPALRTAFDLERFGEPLQLVYARADVELAVDDLRHLERARIDSTLRAALAAEQGRPFAAAQPGLLRFRVHRLDDETMQLTLVEHHAILDGWSVATMLTELFQIYAASLGSGPPPGPPPAASYAEFVALEQEQLQSPAARAHWTRKLLAAGGGELPRLPGGGASGRQRTRGVPIAPALLDDLTRLARLAGTPLKSVFLAAHLRVLGLFTGQAEVTTGLVVNGRPETADGGRVLGLFLNTLPLCVSLPAACSWRELVALAFAAECEMLPFRRFPLAELQRVMNRGPLFTTIVNFIRFHVYERIHEPGGIEILEGTFVEATEFALAANFRLTPAGDAGELSLDYDGGVLSGAQAEALAGGYARVLAAMAAAPEGWLDSRQLLAAAERQLLLRELNDTHAAAAGGEDLHERIAAQARRVPGRVALVCGGERLTYRELQRRASSLAGTLRDLGVGPETRVGLYLDRSPELVVALLAVLAAGGAYVPLDAGDPRPRLAMIVEDSQPALILSRRAMADGLPPHSAAVVTLDPPPAARRGRRRRGRRRALAGQLAYVLFTSGSTGRPKGVQVSHGALLNFLQSMRRRPGLGQDDRLLAVTTLSFDIAGLEILLPLLVGGTVVLATRDEAADGGLLRRRLRESAATAMQATPATWRLLLDAAWQGGADFKVLCGGEAWPPDLAAELCATAASVWNLYGPTETTIWSAVGRIAAPAQPGPVAIGEPIANTRLYVTDRRCELVPPLVTGELSIGGAGLARGYLGQPDLTAERFVPDPWSGEPGARLYRTGDLVRRLPRAGIEFVGRLDQQIKVRGFRIEPGEIEAALATHPAVRRAVVELRPAPTGEPRLTAYLVAGPGAAPGTDELRAWLRQRLPEHLVPAVFVRLDRLPLTPNGKLDRRALPAPEIRERHAPRPPLDPVVEVLSRLWAEALGIDPMQVGPGDSFFALGGHSLIASRLLARVGRAFGVELTLRELFAAPTPAGLAAAIRHAAADRPPLPPITAAAPGEPPALSFAQERLWVLDQIQPGNPAYNLRLAVRIDGALAAGFLERALRAVVDRHAVLRSGFPAVAGTASLRIAAPPPSVLTIVDLAGLPRREETVARLLRHEASRAFDLARAPLMRAVLLRTGAAEHLLMLAVHHIVADEWSLGLWLDEWITLYDALRAGRPSPLPPLPYQYHDFAAWQRRVLGGPVLESQLAYWREALAGAPPLLALPTDRPRSSRRSYRGAWRPFALPAAVSGGLRSLASRRDSTLFMVLLAAFQTLLGRHAGTDDVIVGSPVSGRRTVELESLIGLFVNALVLRARLRLEESFEALLAQLRETVLAAHAHQDAPFERLVEDLQPDRSLQHSPLFQVMLVPQAQAPVSTPAVDLELSLLPPPGGSAKFDLNLYVTEGSEQIRGFAEHSTDLFDVVTIDRWLGHLCNLLAAAAADPARSLAALPLLGAAERHQLLVEWNATTGAAEPDACLHELFSRQAARTPANLAVVAGGERLTYGELDRLSDLWARRLRDMGARPDRVIALYCERSCHLLVGIWAILKAGAAYLPLDQTLPRDRLAYMLADAGVILVLTQRSLVAGLPERPPAIVLIDGEAPEPNAEAPTGRDVAALPDNLVYVIYTSGSTGRPKGVMVPHRGVVNYIVWCLDPFRVADGWGAPVQSAIGFDLTVTSLFLPLVVGGAVRLLPDERGGEELAAALLGDEVYCLLKITPLHLDLLALRLAPEQLAGKAGCLVVAGEALTVGEGLVRWRQNAPATRIINEYGPTETSVGCTVYEVPADLPVGSVAPIGRAIGGVQLYVIDRQLRPVPAGVAGELLIGGLGLARGYLGRPDSTAERFVPNPFGDTPGARLYRSGDLVRALSDGNVAFLGRLDHQTKLRGFRIELGEIEAALCRHPGVVAAVVMVRESEKGKRLVAYVVPGRRPEPSAAELRAFLAPSLPDYMLPAAFVAMSELPLTRNGKVDRAALPLPDAGRHEPEEQLARPGSATEQVLAQVFADLLGVERVGIHESFFHLGGDSIAAILMVGRAGKLGVRITPQQVFTYPTVAQLAAVAEVTEPAAQLPAAPAAVTGEVPLTPIQRWFFELELPVRHHFNQALLFDLSAALEPASVKAAVESVLAHHDALRLRFARQTGQWRQRYAPAGAPAAVRLDLSALPPGPRQGAAAAAAAALQRSLHLGRGPLGRAALLELAPERRQLLLVMHHLVVDGVSWRVLIEDLETAYRQLASGAAVKLPDKTSSFKEWAEGLQRHARSPELLAELAYWLAAVPAAPGRLPVDDPGGRDDLAADRPVAAVLDAARTATLLGECPAAYRARIHELLLAALAWTVGRWAGLDGVLIDVESHGREEIAAGLDLSRTVGWFTAKYPLWVGLAGAGRPLAALRPVKQALRAVPRHGIGFGLLHYLSPVKEAQTAIRALPHADLAWNYLGQLGDAAPEGAGAAEEAPWRVAAGSSGEARARRGQRPQRLTVDCWVSRGRLHCEWSYCPGLHRRQTIAGVAAAFLDALGELTAGQAEGEAHWLVPSDFRLARIDEQQLAALGAALAAAERRAGRDVAGLAGVEDVYPLSPLQEVFLTHALSAPGSGAGFEQASFLLAGPLDDAAFAAAWRRVVERHGVLRTAFVADGIERPLQVVRRRAELPIAMLDWREVPAAEHPQRLQALLAADRQRGFDCTAAPLLRVALVRTAALSHVCVVSHHHLILDGWCQPLMLGEVLALYQDFRRGAPEAQPRSRPFSDYIAWLLDRDPAAAETYWRERLRGMSRPTPVRLPPAAAEAGGGSPEPAMSDLHLPPAASDAVQSLARRQGVTLSTLVHAAWGLVLGRYAGCSDVLFGTTVSGRPAELAGVESMLGMFVNNLPLRLRFSADESVDAWLHDIQGELVSMREHEHQPLAQIQAWSEMPPRYRLFETLVVYQNYPMDSGPAPAGAGDLRIAIQGERLETGYPLTLVADASQGLRLRLYFPAERFDAAAAAGLLRHLSTVLGGLGDAGARTPRDLPLFTVAERRQLAAATAAAAAVAGPETLHGLFGARVERDPGAVAIRHGAMALSHGELDRRANRLARHLRARGVGPEVCVGLLLPPGIDRLVSSLAVLKAGGAFMVLGGSMPPPAAAAPRLVVMGGRGNGGAPDIEVVGLADDAAEIAGASGEDLGLAVHADSLACRVACEVAGDAVAVDLPHRVLVARCQGLRERGSVAAGEALAVSAALEAFPELVALSLAASIVVPGGSPAAEAAPPANATALLGNARELAWRLAAGGLGELRTLVVSGEPPARGLVEAIARAGASLSLIGSGSGADSSWWLPTPPGAMPAGVMPAAPPHAGAGVMPWHGDLEPVPAGAIGELCLREPLPRGFAGQPELTAERLVPDPSGGRPGGRLLRTRELARWLPGGGIELLGPRDGSPSGRLGPYQAGEIGAALRRHPAVRWARVEPNGDGHLVASMLLDGERAAGIADVRAFLRQRLPGMGATLALAALDGLAAATAEGAPADDLSSAPRNPLELELVRTWEELFGLRPIGIRHDFFALGGHSLLAVRLMAEIRRRFGRDLSPALLVEASTIEKLARVLRGRTAPVCELPLVALQPHGSRPPLFCVHPSGGGVLCYVDLAYHLGADQPLYGLEAPGWSDGGEPLDSVGEMASRYLAAVRRMRPQGPYCLAGWSFGGLVAHEMARHLCLQGEEVATLALFDTATGGPDPGGEPDDAQLLSNLIEDAVPISVEELRRLGGLDEQLRHVIDLAQRERLLPDDFDAGRVRRLVEVDRGTHRAASRFTPQPYPGPLTLFRAAEAVGRLRELVLRDPVMGWGSLAGRVEVQVVPGRHDLLVRRPWVEVLAARLGELLAASC